MKHTKIIIRCIKWLFISIIVGMLITVWACSSAPAPTGPSIEITSPVDGSTISAGAIHLDAFVSNFTLANKVGQANFPDEGHINYYLDVAAPTTQGQPAIPLTGSVWAAAPISSYIFDNISVGTHTIYAELVNNDNTPLNPPVVAKVTFTATPGGIP
jgi:hypothetical protein